MSDFDDDFAKRFWQRVSVQGSDDCWQWNGAKFENGYGMVRGRLYLAHRVAYQLTNGDIPYDGSYHGTVVRHTCDCPSCVNPHHLVLGSIQDNNNDTASRGRIRGACMPGEDHNKARLSEDDVRKIRNSPMNTAQLARLYGVSYNAIASIRNGTTWKHVI